MELRYGGQRARIDTMCLRIRRFLEHMAAGGEIGVPLVDADSDDDEQILLDPQLAEDEDYTDSVTSLPELAVPLHVVYASSDQLLDYHRVSRPTYV